MNKISEDVYANGLVDKIKEIEHGLKYYINRTHELEAENKYLRQMYENRVDQYIKETDRKEQ